MKGVAKVAISIPVETLKSLERVRSRLRKTRSAAISEAIAQWLATEELGEDDRRYVEAYLRHPERTAEIAAVAGAASARWEPWE